MTVVKPRALYIGHPTIGDALAGLRPEWEFAPNCETIGDFYRGMSDHTIDRNIQILLVLDNLFDPTGQNVEFENLITAMSPYCLLGVINYDPTQNEAIKERVQFTSYGTGNTENVKYYNISASAPNPDIDKAISQFVKESQAIDAVSIISGRDVSAQSQVEEYGSEHSELGEVEAGNEYLGQIVAVTSSKGGSGKSTISAALGAYLGHASEASVAKGLEHRKLKVIIVDIDVRDGQLGFLTGKSSPTVLQLRMEQITPATIEKTVIYSSKLKVDLLLAPKRPRHSDDTPPEFYVELIQELRKMYDYIILDTSVNYLDPLLEKVAYPVSDQIIFVTDIVISSVYSMTRWIQETTKPKEQGGMGINSKKVGIVVNKALADVAMSSERIEQATMGLPIITAVPSNPKLVAHAANLVSLNLLLKHPDIRVSIRKLARAIVGNKYNLSNDF